MMFSAKQKKKQKEIATCKDQVGTVQNCYKIQTTFTHSVFRDQERNFSNV